MTNNSKITIVDIAQAANVSPSTVSRVLRGTTAVSEEKHQAVMEAVKALNYRPNIFAQSLASGQSMTIGVLTQNFGSPFYDGILQGILLGLEHTSYSPVFADGRWDLHVEENALQTLIDRQIDALIIVGGRIPEKTIQEVAKQIPLIVTARRLPNLPQHCLHVDNFEAAYKATQYLLDKGHRHIAHITGAINNWQVDDVRQRYEGYTQALLDAGLTLNPDLVISGSLQQQSGVIALEGLLARGRPFSAIFAAND
ncbi:MAG: LacI family DNA-binding transcriptional regulator, partial [Anaerolineales bacterium]|nr:LacI family DNA-binding transcriptional regulator [Anaerolineales bacterium]